MTMFKPVHLPCAAVVFLLALSGAGAGPLAAQPSGEAAVTNLPALPRGLVLPLTNAPALSPTNAPAVAPPAPAADEAVGDPDAPSVYEDIALLTSACCWLMPSWMAGRKSALLMRSNGGTS